MATPYGPAPAAPALVGRERELAALRDALAAALAGRGSLVLIGGEAGIGKTTLAEVTLAEATDQGALVLVGRCYDLTETPPYGPWAEALGRAPISDDLPVLPAVLLPPGRDGATLAGTNAIQRRVYDYLAALAARRPLVLLLDDMHWADPASLDLLRVVARDLAALPLLLLATYRSDELTRRHPLYQLLPLLGREARAARLDLRPLDAEGLRALVAGHAALPPADAGRLVTWLAERSEGNAFFTAQLLRALADEGVLRRADGGWALGDLGVVGLPMPLRQVLDARLARLGEDGLRLLAQAAVIGQDVPLALWSAVAETDEEGLLDAVDAAAAARLVAVAPDGGAVRFAHALIREALYEGLVATRRRRVHRRVAEVLAATASPDPDAVAYHLQRAGDDRAEVWLGRAAERARRAYSWVMAAARLEAAHALAERRGAAPGERGWLLLRLAQLVRHADRHRAHALVAEAGALATQAGDPLLAAHARFLRGTIHGYLNDYRTAVADMAAAVAALDALPPPDAATRARLRGWGLADDPDHHRGGLALWYAFCGRFADAIALGEPVAARDVPTGADWLDSAFAPDALRGLGLACAALGRPDEARAALERNLAAYLAAGDHAQVAHTWDEILHNVLLPYRTDDVAERRRVTAEAVRAWTWAQNNGHILTTPLFVAPQLLAEGRWDEVGTLIAPASSLQPSQSGWKFRSLAVVSLAMGRGDYDTARAELRDVFPAGPATVPGEVYVEQHAPLLPLAAELALATDDLAGASAWLAFNDRLLTWSGSVLGRAEGQRAWAVYHRVAGDHALARAHAERALAHATDPRQPLALLAAHRLLGELDTGGDRRTEAVAHLAEALALADTCAAPYERALTLLAVAERDLASGKREGATVALDAARAILEPLEARPALARADALAARLAVPAPTVAPAHPAGLTAREVEVLHLVAQGLPNAAVAARLFLAPRTVNTHLTNIYAKLGVDNRAAATRFAVEHGLA